MSNFGFWMFGLGYGVLLTSRTQLQLLTGCFAILVGFFFILVEPLKYKGGKRHENRRYKKERKN